MPFKWCPLIDRSLHEVGKPTPDDVAKISGSSPLEVLRTVFDCILPSKLPLSDRILWWSWTIFSSLPIWIVWFTFWAFRWPISLSRAFIRWFWFFLPALSTAMSSFWSSFSNFSLEMACSNLFSNSLNRSDRCPS